VASFVIRIRGTLPVFKLNEKGLADFITTIALQTSNFAKKGIQGSPRGGRRYGRHKSSAPGEAPATDNGNLVRKIYAKKTGRLKASHISGAAYSSYLEDGTPKMKARPIHVKSAELAIKDAITRFTAGTVVTVERISL
jgi:hypothetical protein